MKTALVIALLGWSLLPLRAEDWTTTAGQTYRDVQVISHNAAYVTILDRDGGARIRLSKLGPDLQKRFGYDPAKASAIIAATEVQDRRDKQALAEEKSRLQAQDARRMQEVADGIAAAVFAPVPAGNLADSFAAVPNSPPSGEEADDAPPIASEPPTEIDDFDYYGGYGAYGGYGYGYYPGYGGYGYRSYGARGYGNSGNGQRWTHGQGAGGYPARSASPSGFNGFSHR
jgi:hypothetical protein